MRPNPIAARSGRGHGGDVDASVVQRAAVWGHEPGEDVERSRLASAVGTDDTEDLALAYLQLQVGHCGDGAIGLRDLVGTEHDWACTHGRSGDRRSMGEGAAGGSVGAEEHGVEKVITVGEPSSRAGKPDLSLLDEDRLGCDGGGCVDRLLDDDDREPGFVELTDDVNDRRDHDRRQPE